MRLPIRYFSIGLLTASIAIMISFSFFHKSSADLENESIDNITSWEEASHYRRGRRTILYTENMPRDSYSFREDELANYEELKTVLTRNKPIEE